MEVAKHFEYLLNELENSSEHCEFMTSELQNCLFEIKSRLNQLDLDNFVLNNESDGNPTNTRLFEQDIIQRSYDIYGNLKRIIDQLCLLHVYVTNFPLDSLNISKFISNYCETVFGSAKISIISEDFKAPFFQKLIHGEQCRHELKYMKIVEELKRGMQEEQMKMIKFHRMPLINSYLKEHKYAEHIAFRFTKGCSPFFIILHFREPSAFAKYFVKAKQYKTYPPVMKFINYIVGTVINKTFKHSKALILQKLESLKSTIIQIQKNYLLAFVSSKIHSAFAYHPDIPQSSEDTNRLPADSVEIVILKQNTLEIRSNLPWDSSKLNSDLSSLWCKIGSLSKIQEERAYFRNQLKIFPNLFLQFSKKGDLIFQSGELCREFREFVDIHDYLLSPETRSLDVVIGKKEKFLEEIKNIIKECEESHFPISIKTGEFEYRGYSVICKRNEWNQTIEGFCIVFAEHLNVNKIVAGSIENLLGDQETRKITGANRWRGTVKKMKLFLGHQPNQLQQELTSNGAQPVNVEQLMGTIISEYLPEELTNSGLQNASISAVRKIKIDLNIKTGLKHARHNSAGEISYLRSPTIIKKLEKLTPSVFTSQGKDIEYLTSWSIDLGQTEDWIEKSRLVWIILNDMNLIDEYNIGLENLCEFVSQMREGYNTYNNAYHNFDHGLSVMHAAYYITKHISTKFSSLVNLGLLIAAFAHDVDHPGKTNIFEVNSSSRLAIRYHDRSVLEQHHAAYTFRILRKESSNIFSKVNPDDYKELRKLIISNILYTDMKEHFDLMKTFRELNQKVKENPEENLAFNNDDVKILTGLIMHCSDLSGATKDFALAHSWSIKVNQEFSNQVREEESLGIPVTPYFKDLDKKHIMAKQEIAFISFMVKPLWELFNDFCGGAMSIATTNIDENIKEWGLIQEEALKELEQSKPEEKEEKK